MNKFNVKTNLLPMLIMATTLGSCQAIADIFKAGVWVGIIIVVAIIVIVLWLISKAGKR